MNSHVRFRPVWLGVGIVVLALALFVGAVLADSFSITFETYNPGTVDGQDGWSSFGTAGRGCGVYDHLIVNNSGAPASFGTRSLRLSNAVTSGCFSDQTFSRSLLNEAGETSAESGGKSGGTRQPYFDARFDIASTVPGAEQPGLNFTISPDRGDGARMSWVNIADTPTGLQVSFYDYPDDASGFVQTVVASGLDRAQVHNIRVTMAFQDGPASSADPANDIVCIYVDNSLRHEGTSWENYFRQEPVTINPTQSTRTVDSLLFRTSGTAAPATSGKGFLIDNLSLTSGPIPAGYESGCTPAVVPTTPPAAAPTGQPLPLCALFGGGTNPIVRADADYNQFCRIIAQNGEYVQPAAEVGDPALINAGIRQAVDIFEFNANGERVTVFDRPLTVCLQGTGNFYFRDANGQPRSTALLPSAQNGEYTCATVSHAGTVILGN